MSIHHIAAGETALVPGPAKIDLTGNDAAPVAGTIPSPTISTLAPNTGVHATADLLVTVTGTNFTPYTKIQIDGVDKATEYVSATQVKTYMALMAETAARTAQFKARNGNKVSAGSNFTIT